MLASLGVYHASQNPGLRLHEQLDYARVLYNKGFWQQSLRILEKTKAPARQVEVPHIVLLALDFEKLIESRPFLYPNIVFVAGKQDFQRASAAGHAAQVSADEVSQASVLWCCEELNGLHGVETQ